MKGGSKTATSLKRAGDGVSPAGDGADKWAPEVGEHLLRQTSSCQRIASVNGRRGYDGTLHEWMRFMAYQLRWYRQAEHLSLGKDGCF